MDSQVGHAYIVGIWIDEGDGDSAPPILDDSTLFSGESLSGFLNLIPAHRFFYQPHLIKKEKGRVSKQGLIAA